MGGRSQLAREERHHAGRRRLNSRLTPSRPLALLFFFALRGVTFAFALPAANSGKSRSTGRKREDCHETFTTDSRERHGAPQPQRLLAVPASQPPILRGKGSQRARADCGLSRFLEGTEQGSAPRTNGRAKEKAPQDKRTSSRASTISNYWRGKGPSRCAQWPRTTPYMSPRCRPTCF